MGSVVRPCFIAIIVFVAINSIGSTHIASPHRFDCPPKKSPGGLPDVMKCATKFKFMLDQLCKPKYGISIDLASNLAKHVFFHGLKCLDEDYESFLVDGLIDCLIGDDSPGAKLTCNLRTSICSSSLQKEVVACAMKEAKVHAAGLAKMMSHMGHVGKLCNILADGTHRECREKWKDFPALPVK